MGRERRSRTVAGITLALACLAPTATFAAGQQQPEFTGRAVAHHPGGIAAAGVEAPAVQLFHTGSFGAGEPTIGVGRDGVVYSDNATKTLKSSDAGHTWQDITPPGHPISLDSYLYLDQATNRLFKSDLLSTCQNLGYSDDEGATWTSLPAACNLSDHQTIAAGPPRGSTPATYPHVVYNCSQSGGYNGFSTASLCDKSTDGGTTWTPTGTAAFSDPSPYGTGPGSGDSGFPGHCLGDIGHVFVADDGAFYVPRGWCGQPWLAMSRDEGATWTRVQVAHNGMNTTVSGGFGLVAPGSGQSDHEAAVVADKSGNLFFMWMALNRLPYVAVSTDHGTTWSAPQMVAPPGVDEAWGPSLGIDDNGTIALAYLGTSNSPGAPFTADYSGVAWTGYLALIEKPLDPDPLILSAAVSPPGHPLVQGPCGPDRCNPELDFIDVEIGPDGSAWGAFSDAYKDAANAANSVNRELVIGRLYAPGGSGPAPGQDVPEAPYAVLIPLAAVVIVAARFVLHRRRTPGRLGSPPRRPV